MKWPFLIENLKSNYCKLVFLISLVIGHFIMPKGILHSDYYLFGIIFNILFAFSTACMVRGIKEKIVTATSLNTSSIGIIASILGISAVHICGVGNPMCGATVSVGILSTLFPWFLLRYTRDYSLWFIAVGSIIQVISLYYMKCLNLKNKIKDSCKTTINETNI